MRASNAALRTTPARDSHRAAIQRRSHSIRALLTRMSSCACVIMLFCYMRVAPRRGNRREDIGRRRSIQKYTRECYVS